MNDTEKVKLAQLDMLIELKRICDNNKISYFLVGGTLIGAIRHNGFIPWDDDIDVGMIREDYDRFIIACKKELDMAYQLYDWNNDLESPIPFLKMKIKGTHYKENLAADTEMNDEIFIDIFPYDNAPDGNIGRLVQNYNNIIIKKALLLKKGFKIDTNVKGIKKVVYSFLRFISNMRTFESWKNAFEKNAKRYNSQRTKCLISLGGGYAYSKELKRRDLIARTILHSFESVEFSVPTEYDTFLSEIYGDYMKLPPENQRISRHGICLIDLGEYKIRCREVI